MHTQWLFFDNETDGNTYNAACGQFFLNHKQARAWNSGFVPANGDQWGNVWQTSDDPAFWPDGDAAGVLGKWAVPFLGLPVSGWEGDYTTEQGGDPNDPSNDTPVAFPLDNSGDTGGAPTETYDQTYWMGTILNGTFVSDGFVPKWPEDDE